MLNLRGSIREYSFMNIAVNLCLFLTKNEPFICKLPCCTAVVDQINRALSMFHVLKSGSVNSEGRKMGKKEKRKSFLVMLAE